MLKETLGLEPQKQEDGTYIPSPSALKVGAPSKTNYKETNFDKTNNTDKKVLVLCTEDQKLEMQNGKVFLTGNHPVEMFVPILHLNNAGFDVEFCTISGKPVQLEMWAFPSEDENVKAVFTKYESALKNPTSLDSILTTDGFINKYAALFIPGGHGALSGLPDSEEVGKLISTFYENKKIISAICHGPAAFLSLNKQDNFVLDKYDIVAFPDSADAMAPTMGYLPGDLKWKFGKRLEAMGMNIKNTLPDNSTHMDRRLITGASPLSAQKLGVIFTKNLLTLMD